MERAAGAKRFVPADAQGEGTNNFELLYDENAEVEAEKAERARKEAEAVRRKKSSAGTSRR